MISVTFTFFHKRCYACCAISDTKRNKNITLYLLSNDILIVVVSSYQYVKDVL